MQFFHAKMMDAGAPGDLSSIMIGLTPLLIEAGTPAELRVREIAKYLNENADKISAECNIVAVDDLDLDFSSVEYKAEIKFVRTSAESGMATRNVNEIVAHLNK